MTGEAREKADQIVLEAGAVFLAILAAALFILLVGLASGVGNEPPVEAASSVALAQCKGLEGEGLVRCIERAVLATSATTDQKLDLIAQQEMARWAGWLLLVSAGGLLVTGVGTFLIWQQVRLSRKAIEETVKTTRIVARQNELAERTQRPWISIKHIRIKNVSVGQKPSGSRYEVWVGGQIALINTGQSPAHNVRIEAVSRSHKRPSTTRYGLGGSIFRTRRDTRSGLGQSISPSGTLAQTFSCLSYLENEEIKRAELGFLIYLDVMVSYFGHGGHKPATTLVKTVVLQGEAALNLAACRGQDIYDNVRAKSDWSKAT